MSPAVTFEKQKRLSDARNRFKAAASPTAQTETPARPGRGSPFADRSSPGAAQS
jgi:hypothetical protein